MSFSSYVTDKRQLVSQCCLPLLTYEQRLRLRRNYISAVTIGQYVVDSIDIIDPGINYAVGDYLTLTSGSLQFLVRVQGANSSGNINSITLIKSPIIRTDPIGTVTTSGGTGSDAVFQINLVLNPAICCNCAKI